MKIENNSLKIEKAEQLLEESNNNTEILRERLRVIKLQYYRQYRRRNRQQTYEECQKHIEDIFRDYKQPNGLPYPM